MPVRNKINPLLIVILVLGTVIGCWLCYKYVKDIKELKSKDNNDPNIIEGTKTDEKQEEFGLDDSFTISDYKISESGLENFDLFFLKANNNYKNKLYSPLSIKYALGMLNEGTAENSKLQINNIMGDYQPQKYTNSENMSFANAFFVRDTYKTSIEQTYINTLQQKYNAEVITDSFATPDNLNNWVSNKTFNLINNLVDDVSDTDFALVNTLAIDMEWKKVLQNTSYDFNVTYDHEKYGQSIMALFYSGYRNLTFNETQNVYAVEIGASINRYDIKNILGEENIRETVGKAYDEWLLTDNTCNKNAPDTTTYLNQYINEINSNYERVDSSTDFSFYDDDDIKVFAKDLKEYNGTTLEYIAIMPKNVQLSTYIKNISVDQINSNIAKLKEIKLENFKKGIITQISGKIPLFEFDYELKLVDNLKQLGVTDIFEFGKANLSSMTNNRNAYINDARHKTNIKFSNEGIKAVAASNIGGKGAAGCGFVYDYDVPVEKIDLTFDKPYVFIIRDKNSADTWFVGTVYEPYNYGNGELNK